MAGRFVGLAVAAEGLAPVSEQGAQIASASPAEVDVRELAPRTQEDWHFGIAGIIEELGPDDVLVVTTLGALGLTSDDLVDRLGMLAARGAALVALAENIDTLQDPAFLAAVGTLAKVLEAGRDARTRAALAKYAGPHSTTPPKARFVDGAAFDRVTHAHTA